MGRTADVSPRVLYYTKLNDYERTNKQSKQPPMREDLH